MAKTNFPNLAAQVMRFEAMADLPNFEEKRRALLKKLDEVYDVAKTGRNYVDKNDIEHCNPDAGGMVRSVELAARVLGVLTEAERRANAGGENTVDVTEEVLVEMMRKIGYEVKKVA